MLGAHEKPDVTYGDVGGLDMQKQEIREAVELPLTHFDLYKQIGWSPRISDALKCSDGDQVSIHHAASFSTVRQAQARPCSSKQWLTAPLPTSSVW